MTTFNLILSYFSSSVWSIPLRQQQTQRLPAAPAASPSQLEQQQVPQPAHLLPANRREQVPDQWSGDEIHHQRPPEPRTDPRHRDARRQQPTNAWRRGRGSHEEAHGFHGPRTQLRQRRRIPRLRQGNGIAEFLLEESIQENNRFSKIIDSFKKIELF